MHNKIQGELRYPRYRRGKPSKREYLRVKKTGINAVEKAGKLALKEYKNFHRKDVNLKSGHEIVTKVDLASEKIIINEIKKNFKEHEILSEESGGNEKKSDYLWIIDPIDGTTNFTIHNPLWAISLGVAYKNKIIFGFIYAPCLDELFIAQIGEGAKLNNHKIKISRTVKKKEIHTFCHGSNQKSVLKALKYYRKQKLNKLDCRQLGSASMELAYVASGRVESIMIPGAHSWDVAAGALLVREAGGMVTDFEGKKWNLKSKDIVASNGLSHKKILEAINS
jgi:myo-inositol-1(or 4)-monophosphatase